MMYGRKNYSRIIDIDQGRGSSKNLMFVRNIHDVLFAINRLDNRYFVVNKNIHHSDDTRRFVSWVDAIGYINAI